MKVVPLSTNHSSKLRTQSMPPSVEEAITEKVFAAEQHVSTVRLAIVVFNSLVYLFLLDQAQTIQWLAYSIIVIALLYSLYVFQFKPYRQYPVMLTSYFSSSTDALLITFWLFATGGVESPFYVLWYAGIISIAFRYSLRETTTVALVYSICYLGLLAVLGEVGGHEAEIVVRIGYIFLIGSLGAQFAKEALLQIRAKLELRDLAQRLEKETNERKRAEYGLRASEKRLRLSIEQTPAILWAIDADGRITSSLGAGLDEIGLKPNQAIGMSLYEYFQVDDPEFVAVAAYQRALTGESVKFEMEWHERVLQWHLEPLRDSETDIIGVIGVSFDITDSKQAETQRLQLAVEQERVKLLENFISSISHDLKTPLSVIYTNIYLLEKSDDPDKQPKRLETIKAQTQHLERLIHDILTMSRLERDTQGMLREMDVNRLLETLYHHFLSRFEQKNLTITLELDKSLPSINGQEDILDIAFSNLIENAISYTPNGGTVTLRTYCEGVNAVVEVEDTGVGMAAADLPHIFEQFYRVDQARSGDNGGTGLGLAIAKKIVETHGGRIEARSMIGEGSTFTVRLPTAPVTASV